MNVISGIKLQRLYSYLQNVTSLNAKYIIRNLNHQGVKQNVKWSIKIHTHISYTHRHVKTVNLMGIISYDSRIVSYDSQIISYDSRRTKKLFMSYPDSVDPNHPAHLRSLIMSCHVRRLVNDNTFYILAGTSSPGHTPWKYRLIVGYPEPICSNDPFSWDA